MTSDHALIAALERAAAPLRGLSGLARMTTGVAAAVLLFAAAAWTLRLGWTGTPIATLVIWVAAIAAIVMGLLRARQAMARWSPRHVGDDLEQMGLWRRGALTTLLDAPVAGTSTPLHAAAAAQQARDVGARAATALDPAVRRLRRVSWRSLAAVVAGLVGLVLARPASGTPTVLWHPWTAWRALTTPVDLRAGETSVTRGEVGVLHVRAIGRRSATLFTRRPGEAWTSRSLPLDADGVASVATEPLTADLVARVEAGGHRSRDVRIHVRLPAFLGRFTATAHYPAYLQLADEALPTTGDTLVVPEGTRLALSGGATTPLVHAWMHGNALDDSLVVSGSTFAGTLSPRESGSWALRMQTANGAALEGTLPVLPIRVVIDSAPVVEIPVPGADTIATAAMSLPVVVAIRDDHGITSASLEIRRGAGGSVTRMPLALAHDAGTRALLATTLDFNTLGLHPGDTVRYAGVATDNAPVHQVGRSREFVVRVPTLAEQRAARDRETAATATAFDSLSRAAGQLQQSEADLARERQRDATPSGATNSDSTAPAVPLSNEAARQAQQVAQAQQKMNDDATRLEQSVRQLHDAAARNGAADSSLTRQLAEIDQLLDQALSPDLRARLAALQQAVQALNASGTEQALQSLADRQAQLKQAMDQARELFKRAALETRLADLAAAARQLAAEQRDATRQLSQPDSGQGATGESRLAQRTDTLARHLDTAAAQIPAAETRAALQRAASTAREAAASMRDASQSAAAGQPSSAQAAAQQAQQQLDPLAKQIDDDRQSMQAEMRAEVKQALDRALEETSRLAQRQLDVAGAFQRGDQLPAIRVDQALVEEGAAKLVQQLTAVSAMNALVSPQAGVALAEARRLMQQAVQAVSAASPNLRDATDKAGNAVDALAVVAFSLMQSKDRVNGSQSGSGVAEALEEMQRMAGQQGQLAQQGNAMMQQGSIGAQQLMQLAMQQRALAQRLERMRAGGQLPGAGQMARDATDLSHSMEGGRLDRDIVNRQQELFRHMLDAGRSLEGQQDDESQQRHATTARDAPPAIPPPVDPRILRGTGDLRLPSWESLQRLSPEERSRVIEYFQLLMQAQSATTHQPGSPR